MKKETIGRVLIWIVVIIMIFSSIVKFLSPQQIIDEFTAWRLLNYLILIGIIELIVGIILLIPKTTKIGAFLASAYFGGAIVTHLTVSELPQLLLPISILIILTIGILLKYPESLLK